MNHSTNGAAPAGVAPIHAGGPARLHPLRLWPAVALVGLMFVARYAPDYVEAGRSISWVFAVFGPLLCCVLLVIWWLTASRATWKEKLSGLGGLIAAWGITSMLVEPSMRGGATTYLTAPMGLIGFVLGLAWFRKRPPLRRTGPALLLALGGFAFSVLLRNEGMTGGYTHSLHWRWTSTPEEAMLAARTPGVAGKPVRLEARTFELALANPEWPGFRGAERAARCRGPQIATNWSAHPPRQLWKISVGPGWSSFAVAGNLLFTQEQRGPKETMVCYDGDSGREIWIQQVETRFDDPLGGPGPRATPTLANGGLFVTGATGIILRLNPMTGDVMWQQDMKAVAGRPVPMWGFSASPLVTDNVAIVHAGGPGEKGLLAFDITSGTLRWSAPAGNDSYSSPQQNTIAGEKLVLMLSNDGLLFLDPATGQERLNYQWKFMNYRALQPHVVGDDTVLLPTGMNTGTRAIRITKADGQLAAQELWTSRNLKPDFTDFVSHQGFLYGNDAGIFTCLDLKTGERKWKGGRYGKGQVLLLESSGLLLVAAEQGQIVLLRADPNAHTEVASFKALEGKTWNHPVVVGDRLYVRNSQEAAGYVLPLADAPTPESAR